MTSAVSDSKAPSTIYSIQILRAVAALLVVADHSLAHILTGYSAPQSYFDMAWKLGGIGVTIFFVISGFVMVLTNDNKFGRSGEPLRFMVNRIIRIVPLYWLMTLVAAVLFIVTGTKDIALPYLLKSVFFIAAPDPSADNIMQPVLGPGWTLNYEMFFYCIFAVFLLLPKKAAIAGFSIAIVAFVIWGMSSLSSAEINSPATLFSFYANPLLLLFVGGVWLGAAYKKSALFQKANISLVWMFAAVIGAIAFIWLTEKNGWPLALQPLAFIPALLCVATALLCRYQPVSFSGRLGVLLGEASYSIYLSHIIVLAVIRKIVPVTPLYGTLYFIIAFSISTIAGVIIYKLVEMPMTRFIRGLVKNKSRKPAITAA